MVIRPGPVLLPDDPPTATVVVSQNETTNSSPSGLTDAGPGNRTKLVGPGADDPEWPRHRSRYSPSGSSVGVVTRYWASRSSAVTVTSEHWIVSWSASPAKHSSTSLGIADGDDSLNRCSWAHNAGTPAGSVPSNPPEASDSPDRSPAYVTPQVDIQPGMCALPT
jgi:hypothetical protein